MDNVDFFWYMIIDNYLQHAGTGNRVIESHNRVLATQKQETVGHQGMGKDVAGYD